MIFFCLGSFECLGIWIHYAKKNVQSTGLVSIKEHHIWYPKTNTPTCLTIQTWDASVHIHCVMCELQYIKNFTYETVGHTLLQSWEVLNSRDYNA
jgi:hypothetical protein